MRKLVSVLLTLAVVLGLSLTMAVPVAASAGGPPTIDGNITAGEWDGHLWFNETLVNTPQGPTVIPADMLVHIYLMNDADNLYVALDIPDTYDMRIHPEVAESGSDTFGLNIGVEGEARSYSRILQFNTVNRTGDPDWYILDGYFAQWGVATSETDTSKWGPDVDFLPIPTGVQSKTIIGAGGRVQEIAIPLSDLGVSLGTVIRIGGCIRACEPADADWFRFHALYPAGLDWGNASTYKDYTVEANTAVGLTAETPEITAINVDPISVDFGTVKPGDVVSGPNITVENIGTVKISVDASLDPLTGTVFNYLKLKGSYSPSYSGFWDNIVSVLLPSQTSSLTTQLDVPSTYTAQGNETAILVFEATAL